MDVSPGLLGVLREAQDLGFIGPVPLAEHISHAASFLGALDQRDLAGCKVLDLGSGGGIPGLVVADLAPKARLSLLDGSSRRAGFLLGAVADLGWEDRVAVIDRRAEDAGRDPALRSSFDVVLSRGFAPPAVTAECAAPMTRLDGKIVVSEPPGSTRVNERWPAAGCAALGLHLESVVTDPFGFVVLRLTTPCPDRYPRRVGVPTKRPIF